MTIRLDAIATLNTAAFVAGANRLKKSLVELNAASGLSGSGKGAARAVAGTERQLTAVQKLNAAERARVNDSLIGQRALTAANAREIAARESASRTATAAATAGLNQEIAARQAAARATMSQVQLEGARVDAIRKGEMATAATAVRQRQQLALADKIASAEAANSQRQVASMSSARHAASDLSRTLVMTGAALLALPVATALVAASWEKNFADVIRTSDPAVSNSKVQVDALRSSLVSLVQALPVGWGAVTEIATLANQMGIASSMTADFTRAVAMFSATSDVSVEATATAFGRLKSIVPDVGSDFIGLADSILKVGVNSVATEGEIINIVTQISAIASAAGFGSKDMIGFAGALASVRVPPELARGVVTRTFGTISRAIAEGGTKLDAFARISGMSSDSFKKSWGTDAAADTMTNFLGGLRDLGPKAEAELRSLGIYSVRDVPVLLRLSMAADSEGNVGKLLEQTMSDARNAAGETQRQYTIMADTVSAKFKILVNNALALADAMGSSSLGPLGAFIDMISDKLRDLTLAMDDNFKIFGQWDTGIKNSDLVGLGLTISAAAGAAVLLGGALTKVAASLLTIRQIQAAGGFANIIASAMGGGKGGAAAGIGSAISNVAAPAAVATGAVGKFAGALGSVARIGGVVGLALGAVTMVIDVIKSSVESAGTSVEVLAEKLSQVGSADGMKKALEGIEAQSLISRLRIGSEMSKPFDDGGFVAGMNTLKEASDLSYWNNWSGNMSRILTLGLGGNAFTDIQNQGESAKVAFGKLDDAFQQLVDSGNGTKVPELLRQTGASAKEMNQFINSEQGKQTKAYFDQLLGSVGLEGTTKNYESLINGTIPELNKEMYGLGVAVDSVNWEGGVEGAAAFQKALSDTSSAFLDYSAAMNSARMDADGNAAPFNLSTYTDAMNAQVAAQTEWQNNIKSLIGVIDQEYMQHLIDLGPEAADLIAALVLPENSDLLMQDQARFMQNLTNGFSEEVVVMMDTLSSLFGAIGPDLSNALATNLGEIDFVLFGSALKAASANLGTDMTAGIAEAVANGKIPVQTALEELAKVAQNPSYQPKFRLRLDEGAEADLIAKVKGLAEAANIEIPADLTINQDTTMGELRAMLNAPDFAVEIPADVTLEQAYGTVGNFTSWVAGQGGSILLDADNSGAMFTLDTTLGIMNGSIGMPQIDALPALAEGKLWKYIELTNGTTGFVQVDANTGKATGTRDVWVQGTNGTWSMVQVDANLGPAASTVENWHPPMKTITVSATLLSDSLNAQIAAAGKADGGIMSYYANGGVRENHIAQIAPAGTMRVWAEPETGGEAYIPLTPTKRKRSVSILEDVASRFGFSLTTAAQNVARYANGGTYQATPTMRTTAGSGVSIVDSGQMAELIAAFQGGSVVQIDGKVLAQVVNAYNQRSSQLGRG